MKNRDLSSRYEKNGTPPRHDMMGMMDANGDGMLSKEEFMKGHEAMFDRMEGSNDMISLKDMPMKRMGMMGHGDMTGQDDPMPGGMEPVVK